MKNALLIDTIFWNNNKEHWQTLNELIVERRDEIKKVKIETKKFYNSKNINGWQPTHRHLPKVGQNRRFEHLEFLLQFIIFGHQLIIATYTRYFSTFLNDCKYKFRRLKYQNKMKKLFLFILTIIHSFFIYGQSKALTDADFNTSGASKLTFVTTKAEAIELAKNDILKGIPFILLQSGIAPTVFQTDTVFENKFKIHYYEYGCVGPDFEIMKAYNFVIFNFLTEYYGKKWSQEIRKDAIAIRQWKRKINYH